jgi:hypothetical protein
MTPLDWINFIKAAKVFFDQIIFARQDIMNRIAVFVFIRNPKINVIGVGSEKWKGSLNSRVVVLANLRNRSQVQGSTFRVKDKERQ